VTPPAGPPLRGGVTHDQLRRRNLSTLLRYVHTRGPVPRAELTRATGLNRSTTGALVAALTAAGLVREQPAAIHHGAGRPSPVVRPDTENAQVIAVDIGVERITAERVGLGGTVLEDRTTAPAAGPASFAQTVELVSALIEDLAAGAEQEAGEPGAPRAAARPGAAGTPAGSMTAAAAEGRGPATGSRTAGAAQGPVAPATAVAAEALGTVGAPGPGARPRGPAPSRPPGPGRRRCVGVGIAVPGLVRPEDGVVRYAPNLDWTDRPLAAAVAARLGPYARGLPVSVANDADLGALAEYARGAARGCDDFVYVSGNVGVGGGLFLGGRPMPGHQGYAGEIGHMTVNPGGRLCRCGARGCWETEIGTAAVRRAAGLTDPAGRPTHSVSAVVDAARAGDPRAVRALDDAARWTAVGLGNLAAVLDPRLVVFGGDLHEVYAATVDRVRTYAEQSGLARVRGIGDHRVSAFGMRAPLVGAAELAFTPLLDDPLMPRG
jgi:predicted NBD/HSP70 family sugar kinase